MIGFMICGIKQKQFLIHARKGIVLLMVIRDIIFVKGMLEILQLRMSKAVSILDTIFITMDRD